MSINCLLRCWWYDILKMIDNKITLKFVFLLSQSSAGKTALKSSVLFCLHYLQKFRTILISDKKVPKDKTVGNFKRPKFLQYSVKL